MSSASWQPDLPVCHTVMKTVRTKVRVRSLIHTLVNSIMEACHCIGALATTAVTQVLADTMAQQLQISILFLNNYKMLIPIAVRVIVLYQQL